MSKIRMTSPAYDAAMAKMAADGTIKAALDDLKRGARINSLPELMMAAGSRRSVICPSSHVWGRPRPAAFLIGLPARDVFHLINGGMFLYNKPKKVYRGWNVAKKAKPTKRQRRVKLELEKLKEVVW